MSDAMLDFMESATCDFMVDDMFELLTWAAKPAFMAADTLEFMN